MRGCGEGERVVPLGSDVVEADSAGVDDFLAKSRVQIECLPEDLGICDRSRR